MSVFDLIASRLADRRIRRMLRRAVPCAVSAVPDGAFVRVIGTVEPEDNRVLEAPLSRRLCAYYSVEILARPSARSPRVPLADEQECVPFRLVAGGASVVVDPTDAWVSSSFDHRLDGIHDPQARALYDRLGRFAPREELSFREAILGVGERVAVFGAAVWASDREAAGERGYRDGTPNRVVFRGSAKFPLVIRDDVADL